MFYMFVASTLCSMLFFHFAFKLFFVCLILLGFKFIFCFQLWIYILKRLGATALPFGLGLSVRPSHLPLPAAGHPCTGRVDGASRGGVPGGRRDATRQSGGGTGEVHGSVGGALLLIQLGNLNGQTKPRCFWGEMGWIPSINSCLIQWSMKFDDRWY